MKTAVKWTNTHNRIQEKADSFGKIITNCLNLLQDTTEEKPGSEDIHKKLIKFIEDVPLVKPDLEELVAWMEQSWKELTPKKLLKEMIIQLMTKLDSVVVPKSIV